MFKKLEGSNAQIALNIGGYVEEENCITGYKNSIGSQITNDGVAWYW